MMKSIGLLFSFFVIFSASACSISGSNLHSVSKSHPKAPSQNQTEKANVQPASIAPALKPLSFDVPKGVFYEVYVNSFYDSNGDGNGDLKGLTEKLDVLNDGNPKTVTDLGVDGLWLMPINPSPSYHKYDVTNYEAIDPTYGTTKDLQQLVQAAHKRGLKVTMDFVVNHTSIDHPWFQKAISDPKSPYHDYYIWAGKKTNIDEHGSWGQQLWYPNPNGDYYYSTFDRSMPDLNYDNPAVQKAIIQAGQFWLKQGVDGFRLDAAMHIYPGETAQGAAKNLIWWTTFRKKMEEVNPHVLLIGEVWTDSSLIPPYFHSLSSAFDFPLSDAIVKSVSSESDQGIAKQVEDYTKELTSYNTKARDSIFLSNHDENRVMDAFLGDQDKAKVAAGLLLTLPGNPYIYYGEELGMTGSKPDEDIRSPYPWSPKKVKGEPTWESLPQKVSYAQEVKDSGSLFSTYRKWIALRDKHPALSEGDFKGLDFGGDQVVAFKRTSGNETLYILHNLTGRKANVKLWAELPASAHSIFSTTNTIKVQSGNVYLPSYASVVISAQK